MIVVWNGGTQETFLKSRFVIFICQKYVKKGTWKWQKKFTLRLLKSLPGHSISHYWKFLAVSLSPTFLNTGTTNETFQQSGKQDSFRHILKSSASIYESSGSQFFRTTTGIQSEPDTFDESRFAITFLTTLGVIEILCSFRLVLEGKTGKEIPEPSRVEFLEKFLANNFVLSQAKDNISWPLNRGGIADLCLLKTLFAICQKSREPSFWEVMDSFVLVAYASLAASRTHLQRLLACLNYTLDTEDLSCCYKRKKWFL